MKNMIKINEVLCLYIHSTNIFMKNILKDFDSRDQNKYKVGI